MNYLSKRERRKLRTKLLTKEFFELTLNTLTSITTEEIVDLFNVWCKEKNIDSPQFKSLRDNIIVQIDILLKDLKN